MLVIRMYCGADVFMEAVRMPMLCKRRLLFLEAVQIYKVRHVCFIGRSGWGWPGWQCVPCVTPRCVPRVTPDACHVSRQMRATCSQRAGSLQCGYTYACILICILIILFPHMGDYFPSRSLALINSY